MAKLGDFLFGNRNPPIQRAGRFTDQQQQMFGNLFSGLEGGEAKGPFGDMMANIRSLLSGEPGAYDEYEAPLKRQFEQEIIPGIAERFAGLGTGGSLSSSGFQQAGVQAGVDLSERLGALRGQLRQGAMGQLSNLMNFGATPQFEMYQQEPTMGLIPGALQAAGSAGGNALGLLLGGYMGGRR